MNGNQSKSTWPFRYTINISVAILVRPNHTIRTIRKWTILSGLPWPPSFNSICFESRMSIHFMQ